MADPEDMGDACAFLLSDRARHITGRELVVDGGATLGGRFNAGRDRAPN